MVMIWEDITTFWLVNHLRIRANQKCSVSEMV